MTYATITHYVPTYGRLSDRRYSARRIAPSSRRTVDFHRETQAVRGALFGLALSVPLWAGLAAVAYWVLG